jgi:ubiquitin C-terminal hydrolase
MLEGDNAYHCAKCDKKVDAEKRCLVKTLPRFMILSLKRFEFDMEKFIKVKLNDQCEFPLELDMLNFTQEGVSRKAAVAKAKADAQEKGEDFEEEQFEQEPLKRPENYYKYKLNGCVVHAGTAD